MKKIDMVWDGKISNWERSSQEEEFWNESMHALFKKWDGGHVAAGQ